MKNGRTPHVRKWPRILKPERDSTGHLCATTKTSYQKHVYLKGPRREASLCQLPFPPLFPFPLSPHPSPWRGFLTAQPCGKGTHSTCSRGSLPCPPHTGFASRAAPRSSSHTWFSAMAAHCSLLESFKNVNAQPSP